MLNSSSSIEKNRILNMYKRVFTEFHHEPVIDIDKIIKHKFDLSVYRLAEVVSALRGTVPPIKQNCYSIVLVKEGCGEKRIGKFAFPIKENTLYIVPAREVHSSNFESGKCSGYVLFFDIDFFLKTDLPKQCIVNRKVFNEYFQPYLYLEQAQTKGLTEIFENLLQIDDNNDVEIHEMMAIKVLELLIMCDRIFLKTQVAEKTVTYNPVIGKFSRLLEAQHCEIRNVSQYAALLNVHPNYLNYLLKKHTGLSAKQLINNKIISESKYLLSNSALIIKEISSRMGFDDPNNFSSFFQKCTGKSPVLYRLSCPVFKAAYQSVDRKTKNVFMDEEYSGYLSTIDTVLISGI
jgi:AraC family transcriptional activator of pobA